MLNTRSGTNALKFPEETCAYILNHGAKTAPCSAFAARSSGVLRPSAPEFLLNCYRRRLSVEHDRPPSIGEMSAKPRFAMTKPLVLAAGIVEARQRQLKLTARGASRPTVRAPTGTVERETASRFVCSGAPDAVLDLGCRATCSKKSCGRSLNFARRQLRRDIGVSAGRTNNGRGAS